MIILKLEKNGYYLANYEGIGYFFDSIDYAEIYLSERFGFKCKGIKIPLTKYAIIFLRNNNKKSE